MFTITKLMRETQHDGKGGDGCQLSVVSGEVATSSL